MDADHSGDDPTTDHRGVVELIWYLAQGWLDQNVPGYLEAKEKERRGQHEGQLDVLQEWERERIWRALADG